MTVETTVQEMFDRYPLMYSTREECFDHLFCTIGNGYEWKWGQLVYRDRGNPDYDEKYERKLNEDDYARKRRGERASLRKTQRPNGSVTRCLSGWEYSKASARTAGIR